MDWPTQEEYEWISNSTELAAVQLRRYMAEAQHNVPNSREMVHTLLQELRATWSGHEAAIDPLGDFDQSQGNPMHGRKLIVVYGDGETGKSTSVGQAFFRSNIPRAEHLGGGTYELGTALVTSSQSVIAPYAAWFATDPTGHREAGYLDPDLLPGKGGLRRTNFPEKDADGRTPFNMAQALQSYVQRMTDAQARMGAKFPYAGVIFDEFGTMMARLTTNLINMANDPGNPAFKTKEGKPNVGACYQHVSEVLRTVCSLAQERSDPSDPTGQRKVPPMFTVLVCHAVPKGEKYNIGYAKMPSQTTTLDLFGSADLVLRFFKERLKTSDTVDLNNLDGANQPSREEILCSQLLSPDEIWDANYNVRRIQGSSCDLWSAKVRGWGDPIYYPMNLLKILRDTGLVI